MSDVLQEVTEPRLSAADVQARVQDWSKRVAELYGRIAAWLPSDVASDNSAYVDMHEELMREFGVAPVKLPVMRMKRADRTIAELQPRGLWIIGANGRLDLNTAKSHYIIVDRAQNFRMPDWHIAPIDARTDLRPLTAETFATALV